MSDEMDGDYSPFPGSGFAEMVSDAQGGDTFGMLSGKGPDSLPTHPEAKRGLREGDQVTYEVFYKQFDLSNGVETQELNETLTKIANSKLMAVRQERLANDHEGMTVVTLSWMEGTIKKPKKKEKKRVDKDGKPFALQQQYPFPTVGDGEYPGTGGILPPPGASLSSVEAEIKDAFTPNEDASDDDS